MKRMTAMGLALTLVPLVTSMALANSRTEMMEIAEAYRSYVWTMEAKNLTGSCSSSYQSEWTPGSTYTGVTYKWGGFDSLTQYQSKLDDGYGAGSYPSDGVLSCVTGVDCSGFVSRCWGATSKYGTATIHNTSHPIGVADVVRGDAFNTAGYHIVLWDSYAADGSPRYYEALMPKVVYNTWSTWSYLSGFESIRSDNVTGPSEPSAGAEPIVIRQLPFHDERSTSTGSATWPNYSCAPGTNESGPEIVYLLNLDAPGHLTATITDGAGVDVDIHLLSEMDPSTCVARDHLSVGPQHVAAGNWVLVVDSWTNAEGHAFAGAYTLDVTFSPDAGACPSGACGLVCGGCGSGEVCEGGQCVASVQLEPCGEVSYEGECDGDTLAYCSETGLQSGTCASGCCGWVADAAYYDCYEAADCGTCQDECDSGTRGCGQGNTHAWTCVDAAAGGACRVRSWTPCAEGCDSVSGQCAGSACTPDCAGNACGDDGCGGICGTCSSGMTCANGQCIAACTPACSGRVCGDDGCGGSCGGCEAGSGCVDGQCVAGCEPSCEGKVCGDDGCGGSCGSCAAGDSCSGGACVSTCTPSCDQRVCGPDGCGGQCGVCPGGQSCVGGQCAQQPAGGDPSQPDDAGDVGAVDRAVAAEHSGVGDAGCGAAAGPSGAAGAALWMLLALLAWRRVRRPVIVPARR